MFYTCQITAQVHLGFEGGIALSHVNSKSKIENTTILNNVASINTTFNVGYAASFVLQWKINSFLFLNSKLGFSETGSSVVLKEVFDNGFPFGSYPPALYDEKIAVNFTNFHINPNIKLLLKKEVNFYFSVGLAYTYVITGNEKSRFTNVRGNTAILEVIPDKRKLTKLISTSMNRSDIKVNVGLGYSFELKKGAIDINTIYSLGLIERNKFDNPGASDPRRLSRTFAINIAYLFEIKGKG